jgi:hypothetical protein
MHTRGPTHTVHSAALVRSHVSVWNAWKLSMSIGFCNTPTPKPHAVHHAPRDRKRRGGGGGEGHCGALEARFNMMIQSPRAIDSSRVGATGGWRGRVPGRGRHPRRRPPAAWSGTPATARTARVRWATASAASTRCSRAPGPQMSDFAATGFNSKSYLVWN